MTHFFYAIIYAVKVILRNRKKIILKKIFYPQQWKEVINMAAKKKAAKKKAVKKVAKKKAVKKVAKKKAAKKKKK